MPSIGKTSWQLVANSKQFVGGIRKAGMATKKFNKQTGIMAKSVKRAGVALASVFAVGRINSMARGMISFGDTMDKAAKRVGTTTDVLSRLRFMSGRVGVAARTADMAFQRWSRRLGEVAATGKGSLAPTLQRLGLDAERLINLPLDESLAVFATEVAKIDTHGERLAATFSAVDSEGAGLVTLFSQGGDAMRQMGAQAQKLGLVLDQSVADKLAIVSDRLSDLGTRFKIFGADSVAKFAQVILAAAEALTPLIAPFGVMISMVATSTKLWMQWVAFVGDVVIGTAKALVFAVAAIGEALQGNIENAKAFGRELKIAVTDGAGFSRKLVAEFNRVQAQIDGGFSARGPGSFGPKLAPLGLGGAGSGSGTATNSNIGSEIISAFASFGPASRSVQPAIAVRADPAELRILSSIDEAIRADQARRADRSRVF